MDSPLRKCNFLLQKNSNAYKILQQKIQKFL